MITLGLFTVNIRGYLTLDENRYRRDWAERDDKPLPEQKFVTKEYDLASFQSMVAPCIGDDVEFSMRGDIGHNPYRQHQELKVLKRKIRYWPSSGYDCHDEEDRTTVTIWVQPELLEDT